MASRTQTARTTAKKAGKAASEARSNPYLQRVVEDPELREIVRQSFEHARQAYKRMSNGKRPAKALMEDKKLQRELREASSSFREAADQIRGKRRRKRHRGRRLLGLMIVGGVVALILSEDLRKGLLDKLFGSE